ncbi:hypothetical protein ACFQ6O_38320 [Streptomyces sp. NPDC056441]|uniref:hypothetical protein n=1 Tax=Streptomyces sp. NPDC056441 TaxID=3345817 RepID=UPI0036917815
MRKSFALNTEPHVAEIGDELRFEFRPEVMADEFLDAYELVREAAASVAGGGENVSLEVVRDSNRAVKAFLAELMLPESAEQFVEVQLPPRIFAELLEWTLEVYGGGNRPPTSSNGSSAASRPPGSRGTGTSRSKGSTRATGR